jgi:hypothetical protein
VNDLERGAKPKFAWPPFMVAQINVLGKDYRQLYETLENPCIDEARRLKPLLSFAVLKMTTYSNEASSCTHECWMLIRQADVTTL